MQSVKSAVGGRWFHTEPNESAAQCACLPFDFIPTSLGSPTLGTLIRLGIDRGAALSALDYHHCPVTGQ